MNISLKSPKRRLRKIEPIIMAAAKPIVLYRDLDMNITN
jgi:hypothetical protein